MQKIHLQYKDEDSTYLLNNLLTGILPEGVYRGYNLAGVVGRKLQLIGDAYEVSDSGIVDEKVSILRTPQGCMVKETEAVDVELAENETASTRVDLIYCEHRYTSVPGGTAAVYKVRSGTEDNIPVVSDAKTQVPIALVRVPSGWTGGADNIEYERFRTPSFANDASIAHTYKENEFEVSQKINVITRTPVACFVRYGTLRPRLAIDSDVLIVRSSSTVPEDIEILDIELPSYSVGRVIHLVAGTTCHLSSIGVISITTGVSILRMGVGDVVTLIADNTNPRKKWSVVSGQTIPKDDNGNYLIEGNYIQLDSLRIEGDEITNKNKTGEYVNDVKLLLKNGNGQEVSMGVTSETDAPLLELSYTTATKVLKTMLSIMCGSGQINGEHHAALDTDSLIKTQYLLANGRAETLVTIKPPYQEVVDLSKYDYIEYSVEDSGGSCSFTGREKLSAGKEITFVNRGTQSIMLYGILDSATTYYVLNSKSVVKMVMLLNKRFVVVSEKSWT